MSYVKQVVRQKIEDRARRSVDLDQPAEPFGGIHALTGDPSQRQNARFFDQSNRSIIGLIFTGGFFT